ncbi:MAG: DUF2249 domain-containing protein [Cellulomonas sp.]
MPAENVEIEPRPTEHADAGEGHVCGCQHDESEIVLDVRTIPHAIRHATVRGAFGAIPVGGTMVLIAPHRPMPLLAELEADAGGALTVEFLVEEPSECHVRLTRTAPAVA